MSFIIKDQYSDRYKAELDIVSCGKKDTITIILDAKKYGDAKEEIESLIGTVEILGGYIK